MSRRVQIENQRNRVVPLGTVKSLRWGQETNMALDNLVLDVIGKALNDPNPTKSDLQACQLANALGYPNAWRVVRSVDETTGKLYDRIYSGNPGTPGCDCWFNHATAMEAAAKWEATPMTQHAFRGGDLLGNKSRFKKGDKVEVLYDGAWWDAKILRVKEAPNESFRYQVHYTADSSRQSGVDEQLIRPRQDEATKASPTVDSDPGTMALALGFGEGWQATGQGKNRWKLVAPTGETFRSKKTAMAFMLGEIAEPVDPAKEEPLGGGSPWRNTDNEYLGRKVLRVASHQVTARRIVDVEQLGTVVGWISEKDVGKNGKPEHVSKSGEPSKLFRVQFELDRHSRYAELQVTDQDYEEDELKSILLPPGETHVPKKDALYG